MTKYARQLANARKTIIAKGTTCTWYKPGAHVGNDPTPEFPELEDAEDYPDIPIVLYPEKKATLGTIVYNEKLQTGDTNLFGMIPGDVPFKPEENDSAVIGGVLYSVNYVNTTMPDGTPIIHELGFK